MNCQKIRGSFIDLLTGEISSALRKKIQAHIAECEFCRAEFKNLREIWFRLGVIPDEPPPESLRARFYTMLDEAREKAVSGQSAIKTHGFFEKWIERFWPRHPAFQFAVSLLFLIVGLTAGFLLTSTQSHSAQIEFLQQEMAQMHRIAAFSLLNHQSPGERLRGIHMSCQLDSPDDKLLEQLFFVLNYDSNINVRLAAVDALYLFHLDPRVKKKLTEALQHQDSPLLQVALVDMLVSLKERRAAESLRMLLERNSLNPEVEKRIQDGLKKLI